MAVRFSLTVIVALLCLSLYAAAAPLYHMHRLKGARGNRKRKQQGIVFGSHKTSGGGGDELEQQQQCSVSAKDDVLGRD